MTALLEDLVTQSLAEDPQSALTAVVSHIRAHGSSPVAEAVLAFVQVLNCHFDAAAAWQPVGEDPLVCATAGFVDAVCLAQVPEAYPAPVLPSRFLGLQAFVTVEAAMSAGQILRADSYARALRPHIAALSSGTYWAWNQVALARSLAFQGRFTDARVEIDLVLADERSEQWPAVDRIARGVRAFVAAHEGDSKTSQVYADQLFDEVPNPQTYFESAAFILAGFAEQAAGRVAEVDRLILAGGGGRFLPRFQVVDRVYAFEILVESALARGEEFAARDWLDLAEAHDFAGHDMVGAAVARCRARIAIACEDAETGARESILSRDRAGLVGGYLEVLRSQLLEAGAVRTQAVDTVAAGSLEKVALEAAETGARVIRDWAMRELTLRGRRLRNVPGHGWEALTDRQRLVAALAAQGLRNREIGTQLFVSERTVEGHIAAVLDALGAPSRVSIGRYLPTSEPAVPGRLHQLTPRQRVVADLVASGASNAAIAQALTISEKTVEKHIADLFLRLQVRSRAGIAALMRSG